MAITPHPNSQATLIVPTLTRADPVRLEKAIDGLFQGTLTVTLTSTSEGHISALVKNSTRSYQVSLTADEVTCDCLDSLHRDTVCKHSLAVALFASHPPAQAPAVRHLLWSDGQVLCGAQAPMRVSRWPWPGTLVQWEDTCSECRSTYHSGYQRQQQAKKAEATARRKQGEFTRALSGQGTRVSPGVARVQPSAAKAA